MLIMGLLFVLLTTLGRGALVRWMAARPGRIATVTSAMLLTVGALHRRLLDHPGALALRLWLVPDDALQQLTPYNS